MKKIFLSLFAAMMFAVGAEAQSSAKIILAHDGNSTMFDVGEMNLAMESAVDGDTLYLSEGSHLGFTIEKKLALIGAGQETIISGDINVEIPDSVELDATLLQGVRVRGSINVNKPVNHLVFRKCKVEGDLGINKAMVSDVQIENCEIYKLRYESDYNREVKVVGSFIHDVYGGCIYCTFINCNIGHLSYLGGIYCGTCINSIIGYCNLANSPASFKNCLYNVNSFDNRVDITNSWTFFCGYDALDENGNPTVEMDCSEMLGTDGTPIGFHGGPIPYTLEPSLPTVSELKTEVSNDRKTLNVTVKFKEQK